MAQTSITVPVSKLYEGLYSGSQHKYYYKNMQGSSILLTDTTYSSTADKTVAYIGLPDLKATLGRHFLYKIAATIRVATPLPASGVGSLAINRLEEPLSSSDPGSVFVLAPAYKGTPDGPELQVPASSAIPEPGQNVTIDSYTTEDAHDLSYFAYLLLTYGAFMLREFSVYRTSRFYSTLENGNAPTVTIYYDDSAVVSRSISSVSGLKSGYWNPREAHTIGWILEAEEDSVYFCLDTVINPVHETLYWRISGAGSWNSLAMPDYASSYSVPANTFPVGETIEWYISVTDEDNVTSISDTFTVTTDDSTSTATPTAPVNSVEIGNEPITFKWTVRNSSGALPSRVVVEWATAADAAEWTLLLDESEAIYKYDAPAGTFPGGSIYWRVTSYNQDSEAGPTSDPALFTCVAPPLPPTNVTASSAPFSTISWQSVVQTAYEILIDGKSVAKLFGNDVYSYTLQDPLDDGEHTFGVRLQGPYGFWSTVTSTVVVTENQGTGTISIAGQFDVDANLSWYDTNTDEGKVYRIYRDGKMIARTQNDYFVDRFVLGQHAYSVLAELPGGNYIRSQLITGVMTSRTMRIAAAAGGDWIELRLTESSNGTQKFEWKRNVTLRHYAGSAYPVAEFSPYENRTASYDCAFTTAEEAEAFEQLQGQVVIMKSRYGEAVVGPMNPVIKTTNAFYITYRFSVQQIHWEDLIDDTVS